MRLEHVECPSCHIDVHDGRFEGGAHAVKGSCAACHDARAFRPSTMGASEHATDDFPLEGAHRATPCVACHTELERRTGGSFLLLDDSISLAPLTLELPKRFCVDCHATESPHGDQFDSRQAKGGCEGCHSAAAFASADRFDHDEDTRFSLGGAHAKVACFACHVPTSSATAAQVRYRPLSSKCESCHDDATARRPAREGHR